MGNKIKFSEFASGSGRIVGAVNKAIELKVIKFENADCFIFREVFARAIDKKNYVKNLYIYARLRKFIKEGQALFLKDIENGEILAFHKNGQSTVY